MTVQPLATDRLACAMETGVPAKIDEAEKELANAKKEQRETRDMAADFRKYARQLATNRKKQKPQIEGGP